MECGLLFFLFFDTRCQPGPTRIFPQTLCNLRRNCVCFPQYPRLTFWKVLLITSLQKAWKSIWGHNEIIRLLGWVMEMGHFPVQQQARNQLPLYVNQTELILKFITSQDMTGQFGNLWTQTPLEFTAHPKQWQMWSRPDLMAKVMQRQIKSPWSSCSNGGLAARVSEHWMALCHRRMLFVN